MSGQRPDYSTDSQGQPADSDREGDGASFTTLKPHHPDPKTIVCQKLANKTLRFQRQWYEDFPWLHVIPGVEGVLCFYCQKAFLKKTSQLAKNTDQKFISTGFKNWKKGRERFALHARSECHKIALTTQIYETRSVDVQLSNVRASQQEKARSCLLKIIRAVQFLARQGLALRGHNESEGNFAQLLGYKSEDDPELRKWLSSREDYTSPKVQNEILSLLSHSVVREIVENIRSLPQLQFSVIMDGTQDVSGKEQEAVVVRYADHDLIVHEEFVGMYEVSETTGENLAKVIMDVLLRLNLSITGLRGQAYDGAANMAGIYSGAQAIIKKQQPLAPYVHCGAHCVNLITKHACSASSVVRDSLQWAHDLGVLFGQSIKMKSIFQDIVKAESGPVKSIRPLCPTRWTVRTGAIQSLLNQYQPVLHALQEMASGKSDSAAGQMACLKDCKRAM